MLETDRLEKAMLLFVQGVSFLLIFHIFTCGLQSASASTSDFIVLLIAHSLRVMSNVFSYIAILVTFCFYMLLGTPCGGSEVKG